MARIAEAVGIHDIDVARARGVALFEDARALVGERRHDARDDLVVFDLAPLDASPGGFSGRNLIDQRIRDAITAALLVFVPTGAGLLAVVTHLVQPIGHFRL